MRRLAFFAAFAAAALAAPAIAIQTTVDTLELVREHIASLPSRSDWERFGRIEYWEAADASGGDCEDKALAARAELLHLGWATAQLRLALAWDETGTYHAVLTVDTGIGGSLATYVIDNRLSRVENWSALSKRGYRWDIRQDARGHWRRFGG